MEKYNAAPNAFITSVFFEKRIAHLDLIPLTNYPDSFYISWGTPCFPSRVPTRSIHARSVKSYVPSNYQMHSYYLLVISSFLLNKQLMKILMNTF